MSQHGTIATRLAAARAAAGLSRRGLSIKAELPQAITGQIEREVTKQPRIETLSKLAKVLGVSVEWLAFGVGEAAKKAAAKTSAKKAAKAA